MDTRVFRTWWQIVPVAWGLVVAADLRAGESALLFMPEQRSIEVREAPSLPAASIPLTPRPPTITHPIDVETARALSLDDAIRIALANAQVVRVLTGVAASASGRTIYDAAITNTTIDEQRARFDPTVEVQNQFNRVETPRAEFTDPSQTTSRITGQRTDNYQLRAGVSKTTTLGGTASLNVETDPTYTRPGVFPLNPQSTPSLELQLTQPLLQGAGRKANLAPIVVARIDTERSYFQFKDSVQELVRGTIDAYWAVVFARTDVWAREQQVRQAQWAFDRTAASFDVGSADIGDVAQAQTALANFRANLLASRANLLQREAALRNLLGLPAYDPAPLTPVTQPLRERLELNWEEILALAEVHRPDLIELKLILDADQQLLYQASNRALPRADAVALYRWNGLEGEMPIGADLSSEPGAFTDWTLAVNFSVPLGLRQSRAALRRQELVTSRDRANLSQGLHNAAHELALTLRNLAQFYEQYIAYTELRNAAQTNLNLQLQEVRGGRENFLVILQAITDWGNAVSLQAQTLLQYNTELANLERRTGTILETHGVRFYEERFETIGPLGRLHRGALYPQSLPPAMNWERYGTGSEPAEEAFDLADPFRGESRPERLPAVRPNVPSGELPLPAPLPAAPAAPP